MVLAVVFASGISRAGDLSAGSPTTSLRNRSFDEPASDPEEPPGWGSQSSSHGTAKVVSRAGAVGGSAVELAPKKGGSKDQEPFTLYQILDHSKLRGKKVEFGARIATDGAGVNLVVWSPEGMANELMSETDQADFVEQRGSFRVPNDASLLTFGVQVLGPAGSRVWVDDAFVKIAGTPDPAPAAAAGSAASAGASGSSSGGQSAKVAIHAGTVERDLPPEFFGMHLDWAENATGIVKPGSGTPRADVVELLRPLRIPIFRYPGGIHADFYDWKKGVGPSRSRGGARNAFTKEKETALFGSPEFVDFAKQLGADACITTNFGTGTPADAGAWAKWFAENGFKPSYWEVGNEIYLSGPSSNEPNSKEIYRSGAQYAREFPAFASAIKSAIPEAKVGAIAHFDTFAFPMAPSDNRNWTRDMLDALTVKADFFALHNGYAPVVIDDSVDLGRDAGREKLYRALFAAPIGTRQNLDRVAEEVKRRSPANARTPFAITEFGALIGISGDPKRHLAYVDYSRTQAAALYTASVLDVYMGDPRVHSTMFVSPVHHHYGGLVLADPSGLVTSPTYFLYRFYRERFEPRIVATETTSPTFSSTQLGVVKAHTNAPTLMARASKSANGRRLTVLLVNRSIAEALETDVSIDGFEPARVNCEILAAPQLNAINGPSLTGTVVKNSNVKPRPFACESAASQRLTLPPGSIVSLVAEAS
jgi:alpha-N-arabinofuranosidase